MDRAALAVARLGIGAFVWPVVIGMGPCGLFAGLIAPFAFSWIAEYPILLALAALCRPVAQEWGPRWGRWYSLLSDRLAILAPRLVGETGSGELARGQPFEGGLLPGTREQMDETAVRARMTV